MIAQAISELYGYVGAVPGFASIGLLVGGKSPDPGLTKIPLPAAWLIHEGGKNTQAIASPNLPVNATTQLGFAVMVYVPYTSQTDLINNQFPLLESLIAAVHGQTSQVTGQRWYYAKHRLVLLNADRLGFHVSFVLDAAIS